MTAARSGAIILRKLAISREFPMSNPSFVLALRRLNIIPAASLASTGVIRAFFSFMIASATSLRNTLPTPKPRTTWASSDRSGSFRFILRRPLSTSMISDLWSWLSRLANLSTASSYFVSSSKDSTCFKFRTNDAVKAAWRLFIFVRLSLPRASTRNHAFCGLNRSLALWARSLSNFSHISARARSCCTTEGSGTTFSICSNT